MQNLEGQLYWEMTLLFGGKKFSCAAQSKKEGEQELASQVLLTFFKNEATKQDPFSAKLLTPSFFGNEVVKTLPKEDPEKRLGESEKAQDVSVPKKGRVAVIIDLENLPKFPKEIDDLVGFPNLDIYAVCSAHYHGESFAEVKGIKKVLSPALGANASDLCITMLVGAFLRDEKYDGYLLASRDKFVAPLTEIIRNGTNTQDWKPKPAYIISSRKHLIDRLSSI